MIAQPIIRLYRLSDRESVRKICADTADLGKPLENFFSDREVFADIITRYYTDFQAQSLLVADYQKQVVGYLTGCLDTAGYTRIMRAKIYPKVFIRAVWRGVFWQKNTWRLVIAILKSFQLGGFHRPDLSKDYPAHFHINIRDGFRHQGLGQLLAQRFLTQAKEAACPGVWVSTREDNQPACNFFEHLGFSILGRYPMISFKKDGNFCESYTVIYGRRL